MTRLNPKYGLLKNHSITPTQKRAAAKCFHLLPRSAQKRRHPNKEAEEIITRFWTQMDLIEKVMQSIARRGLA